MSQRIKCPKSWKYAKLIIGKRIVFYRKITKITSYFYAINVPKGFGKKNILTIRARKCWPFIFTGNLIKETKSYFYIVIPQEVVKILRLNNDDILEYEIGKLKLIGKVKKKSNSLLIQIPASLEHKIKSKERISLIKKLRFIKSRKRIRIVRLKKRLYFDCKTILPFYTTRDKIYFRLSEQGKKLIVFADFKHVNGTSFKYVTIPRYIPATKLALFLGLMHSDGFKKFGYKEIYNKHIYSPYVGFTNGDPFAIRLFSDLYRELFNRYLTFSLTYPNKLTDKQKKDLNEFWKDCIKNDVTIYTYKRTRKTWCPAGIVSAREFDILMAEIVVSMLKKFIKNITEIKMYDILRNFMIGVLIGDGSPILDKGVLRRIMIATEFKEEAEIYKKALKTLGFESRNLWKEGKNVPSYLRKLDIRGDKEFLLHFTKNLNFGFYCNNAFFGSIEKQFRLIKGLLSHSRIKDKEFLKLEFEKLKKTYCNYLKNINSFIPLSEKYGNLLKVKANDI